VVFLISLEDTEDTFCFTDCICEHWTEGSFCRFSLNDVSGKLVQTSDSRGGIVMMIEFVLKDRLILLILVYLVS